MMKYDIIKVKKTKMKLKKKIEIYILETLCIKLEKKK